MLNSICFPSWNQKIGSRLRLLTFLIVEKITTYDLSPATSFDYIIINSVIFLFFFCWVKFNCGDLKSPTFIFMQFLPFVLSFKLTLIVYNAQHVRQSPNICMCCGISECKHSSNKDYLQSCNYRYHNDITIMYHSAILYFAVPFLLCTKRIT